MPWLMKKYQGKGVMVDLTGNKNNPKIIVVRGTVRLSSSLLVMGSDSTRVAARATAASCRPTASKSNG